MYLSHKQTFIVENCDQHWSLHTFLANFLICLS